MGRILAAREGDAQLRLLYELPIPDLNGLARLLELRKSVLIKHEAWNSSLNDSTRAWSVVLAGREFELHPMPKGLAGNSLATKTAP